VFVNRILIRRAFVSIRGTDSDQLLLELYLPTHMISPYNEYIILLNINIVVFEDDYSIFFAQRQLLKFARTRCGRFELVRLAMDHGL